MNGRLTGSVLVAALGGAVLAEAVTGRYAAFVRPVMRIPLGLAGAAMMAAGLVGIMVLAADRGRRDQHDHGTPVAVLLAAVPLAVLLIARPAALDASAADRVAAAPRALPRRWPRRCPATPRRRTR